MGGHVVQGHVDGKGRVRESSPKPPAAASGSSSPPEPAPLLRREGVDRARRRLAHRRGLDETGIDIALVPHTLEQTTLGSRAPGDFVNVEVDILAKYVERLIR